MKLKLIEKRPEVPGVETLIFALHEPLTWKAGQYIHYVLHHEPTDDRGSDRYFTNSAAPFEKIVRITTRFDSKKSSSFKTKLKDLAIGKSIEISNITGDFTVEDPTQKSVFIAGGIGITPFRSILKDLEHNHQPINVTLLYSNRDENVVFKDELEGIPGLKIHYIFSPERIDEAKIKELVPDIQKPVFYVSGPEPMVDALSGILKKMGIGEDHIKLDEFPNYPAE